MMTIMVIKSLEDQGGANWGVQIGECPHPPTHPPLQKVTQRTVQDNQKIWLHASRLVNYTKYRPPCWLVASMRALKRDVISSAQGIQWNPLNGMARACFYS